MSENNTQKTWSQKIDDLYERFKYWLSCFYDEEDIHGISPFVEVRDLPPPEIVSREEWGARAPDEAELEDLQIPVTAVIFHHTRTRECKTKEECMQVVREIQDLHMDKLHWPDIGYNFLIGGDARVYEGRGWNIEGSHTDDWNEKSFGVAAIGNFMEEPPSDEMLETIEKLVGFALKDNKYLKFDYSVVGHNQVDSIYNNYTCNCPGDAFYEEVTDMPHWVCGPDYIECKEVPTDEFDSLDETPIYWTDLEFPSDQEDYPKGYNERIFGPSDPNEE